MINDPTRRWGIVVEVLGAGVSLANVYKFSVRGDAGDTVWAAVALAAFVVLIGMDLMSKRSQ